MPDDYSRNTIRHACGATGIFAVVTSHGLNAGSSPRFPFIVLALRDFSLLRTHSQPVTRVLAENPAWGYAECLDFFGIRILAPRGGTGSPCMAASWVP